MKQCVKRNQREREWEKGLHINWINNIESPSEGNFPTFIIFPSHRHTPGHVTLSVESCHNCHWIIEHLIPVTSALLMLDFPPRARGCDVAMRAHHRHSTAHARPPTNAFNNPFVHECLEFITRVNGARCRVVVGCNWKVWKVWEGSSSGRWCANKCRSSRKNLTRIGTLICDKYYCVNVCARGQYVGQTWVVDSLVISQFSCETLKICMCTTVRLASLAYVRYIWIWKDVLLVSSCRI